MTQAIVRKGFESRLKTWADAQTPAIPIAWPNVPFTPPAGRYIVATLLPARTAALFLDTSGRTLRGVFQASIFLPLQVGIGSAESLAASLDTAFGESFDQDGLRITLVSPMSTGPAMHDATRCMVPVSCEYRADVV